MVFHYQRMLAEGGCVNQVTGEPPGTCLAKVLEAGLPPLRVGLELGAAFCAILHIAHEDGELHGDIRLEHVYLTGDGTVSIGGFGEPREQTHAPESTPRGAETDYYGLGRLCAAALMADSDMLDELSFDSLTAHEREVADFVMSADLEGLSDDGENAVRYFVLHLLSFDRRQRPEPLRVWRTLLAYARTQEGDSLAEWALAAMRGEATRREISRSHMVESLAPPVSSEGPLSRSFTPSFSEQGSRTKYWAAPAKPVDRSSLKVPEDGGGAKTGHWTRAELVAMANESTEAPRPRVRGHQGAAQTAVQTATRPRVSEAPEPDISTARDEARRRQARRVVEREVVPVVTEPHDGDTANEANGGSDDESSRPPIWLLATLVFVFFLFLGSLLLLAVAVMWHLSSGGG